MPIDSDWMRLQLDPELRDAAARGGDLTVIGFGSSDPIWRRVEGPNEVGGAIDFDPDADAEDMDFDDYVAVMTCADREVLRMLSEGSPVEH